LNKLKIINDPVYGFITIPYEIIFDLIEHSWFQRLRRINQLGISQLVYPGAIHTRFHHALGALHLTTKAMDTLEQKGVEITLEERMGTCAAILLHDIGHGPFSHVLEDTLLPGIHHETLSLELMHLLNEEFDGKLNLAIEIFNNTYSKSFLHQLISSQLDMDRLDYLTRDSFYTGVSEGIVGIDRIISMLAVVKNELVVEEKGIYSIEKFIIARRLMYWQVYLHKTTLSADHVLTNIIIRAKELVRENENFEAIGKLKDILTIKTPVALNRHLLETFTKIDDVDVLMNMKLWVDGPDLVLSKLCDSIINRKLPKIVIQNLPFDKKTIEEKRIKALKQHPDLNPSNIGYFVNTGKVQNEAYTTSTGTIKILTKEGKLKELAQASDNFNIMGLTDTVTKHYLCYLD